MLILSLLLFTSPLAAAPPVNGDKPKTDSEMVTDTVGQPLTDLNMRRKAVPAVLTAVRDNPYAIDTIRNCRELIVEIDKLNAALGPDLDQIEVDGRDRKRKEGMAQAAGGLVSSLIPFRFLIREISGAGAADRDYREAIYAGVVRRGFLKGWGQNRGCAAPGRPLRPLESAPDAALTVLGAGRAK
jgi:hypothetical protein